MVTSNRTYAKGNFQDCCCHCPSPCGEPLLTHASTGDPLTLANRCGSVSCGVTTPFPWVLVHERFCLCPPRVEPLFLSVLWNSHNQIPPVFKVRFPVPLQNSQTRKPDMGLRTFTRVKELLWYYCSPVCGLPSWQACDLILLWLRPFCHLIAASSFSLDMRYFFLVSSSILLLLTVPQLVVILVLLQEEMSTHPSTLPSWTRILFFFLYNYYHNITWVCVI